MKGNGHSQYRIMLELSVLGKDINWGNLAPQFFHRNSANMLDEGKRWFECASVLSNFIGSPGMVEKVGHLWYKY